MSVSGGRLRVPVARGFPTTLYTIEGRVAGIVKMNKHREVYLERLGDMRHVFGPPLVMEAGFAFDVETISDARDLGAEWVIVVTRNGRKRWIARLDAFAEHGQPFRVEGYNAQLCLALRHWKVRELTRHLVGAS